MENKNNSYKYIFGPVASRRLGISLGIDPVPFKTCPFNCVYCECGITTKLSSNREEYIPADAIIKELDDFLSKKPVLDYITFAGSGEPLLNKGLGNVIAFIKEKYSNYKIAVLTSSYFLGDKDIQKELKGVDLIVPSLDAAFEDSYIKINRPVRGLSCSSLIDGLVEFSNSYNGNIWMEIFIVPGINDSDAEINEFAKILNIIKPQKVQLNSLDRPGTESWVKVPELISMEKIQKALSATNLNVEIISRQFGDIQNIAKTEIMREQILDLIKRRPCTMEDLIKTISTNKTEIQEFIDEEIKNNRMTIVHNTVGDFFKIL